MTTRRILIAGGGFDGRFIRLMAQLAGRPRPRVCYLPTAVGDDRDAIVRFYALCAPLAVEPFVQRSFISSYEQAQGWDEVLLSADAIVASGGNTLNQQAIWRAQGIDAVLRTAWERGIVLGGSSAGSLCWFEEGTTDSRPKELSIVQGLGFLPGSHAPHYDGEAQRRPQYRQLIASGALKPGWACDNDAGILFEGTTPARFVATRAEARVYHVTREGDEAVEREVVPEPIG